MNGLGQIPVTYVVPRENTSPRWGACFAAGCGGALEAGEVLHPGPVAMFGSPARWDILTAARAEGRTWYYGDHGYFGRGQHYRCTRNAWQHDGSGTAGPARFESFGLRIQPWRGPGRDVLVCPPGPVFAALHGFDADAWLAELLGRLRARTGRRLRVRRKGDPQPLEQALRTAHCVVTYMSNVAVEALVAGVPVVCLGPCAAATLGGTVDDIDNPPRPPGRDQFLFNLAANQWTLDEMARGELWPPSGESDDRPQHAGRDAPARSALPPRPDAGRRRLRRRRARVGLRADARPAAARLRGRLGRRRRCGQSAQDQGLGGVSRQTPAARPPCLPVVACGNLRPGGAARLAPEGRRDFAASAARRRRLPHRGLARRHGPCGLRRRRAEGRVMQFFHGLALPDGEKHLPEWMTAMGVPMRDGLPTYQEHKYVAALRHVRASRRCAVDVGAHVGQWSRVMSLDFAEVIAFEPVPRYAECWRHNMAARPNAQLHEVALGAGSGSVDLVNVTPGSHGDTRVEFEGAPGAVARSRPMTTLDSFLLRDVDLLKVDCEGFELFVLEGARETLLRCRPCVIVEQKPGHAQRFNRGEQDAVAFLAGLGATLHQEIAGDFILSWGER